MSAKGGNGNLLQVIQTKGELPNPTPAPRLRLGTVLECRRELAKLYSEARRGEIEGSVATRLAYMLTSLASMIRDSDLEERISALENSSTPR